MSKMPRVQAPAERAGMLAPDRAVLTDDDAIGVGLDRPADAPKKAKARSWASNTISCVSRGYA
ncbi:hypothetical protein [Mesorhizobium sp. M0435]|uniref:hypothetical protein n=1 Tax=Mesorhizobium sp. M0435 TaxID=2956944 RepID=UPI0033361FFD